MSCSACSACKLTCSKALPSFAVIILLRCNFNFVNKIFCHWFEFLYTNFIEDSFVKAMENTVCPRGWNCSKNWISLRDRPFLTYFASKFVACRINIVQKGFILWNGRFCRLRDFKLPFKFGFRSCVLRYVRKKLRIFPLRPKNQDVSIVCVHDKEKSLGVNSYAIKYNTSTNPNYFPASLVNGSFFSSRS